jgi:hypothetical protein
LSNLPLVTAQLKWPERRKKAKILVGNVEISGVSRQIFAGVEMSNLKKGSRITPPVKLNEKPQYRLAARVACQWLGRHDQEQLR